VTISDNFVIYHFTCTSLPPLPAVHVACCCCKDIHNMICWHLWEAHVCCVFTIYSPCSSSSGSFDDSFKTIAAYRETVTLRRICKYMSLCLVSLCIKWEVSTAVWRFMMWKSVLWHCIVMQEVGLASKEPSTSGYTLCSLLPLAELVI